MSVKTLMKSFQKQCTLFMQSTGGATAIEYGLIASLIAVVIIGAAQTLGEQISDTFTGISNSLAEVSPPVPTAP